MWYSRQFDCLLTSVLAHFLFFPILSSTKKIMKNHHFPRFCLNVLLCCNRSMDISSFKLHISTFLHFYAVCKQKQQKQSKGLHWYHHILKLFYKHFLRVSAFLYIMICWYFICISYVFYMYFICILLRFEMSFLCI